MSYDVNIGDGWFNYTFNVAALFYDHMPAERCRGGLHELEGLSGVAARKLLNITLSKIDATRSQMGEMAMAAKYDAPNGWGSVKGAVAFLIEVRDACANNPRKKLRVSA